MTDNKSKRKEAGQMPIEWRLTSLYRAAIDQPLLPILVIAFVLRALAGVFFTGPIESEGAEYARIAQNLLSNNGYVGIAEEDGRQLFFPPLFPFMIAAVSLLTGDTEIAGRIISVTMGALIVLPTYFLAMKMYDRRTATLAAALVGFHPFLIYMSTTVFCEMTFLTLILAALCLALSATENPTPRNLFSCGAVYGLAYLVRPEAAAYMLIAATLIFLNMLIRQRSGAAFTSVRVGLMICTFVVVAAPYVAWLSAETGQFRIEGKSPLNIETGRRIQLGEDPLYAEFGVDSLGNERGVWNQPNLVTIHTHAVGLKELATYIRLKTKSVVNSTIEALASSVAFGSPPLFAFAILGLFARPWSPSLATFQLHIFGVISIMILGTYFIYYSDLRFYLLLIPFYCIWASVGLWKFVLWGMATGFSIGLPSRYRFGFSVFVWALGLGLLFVLPMRIAAARLAVARAERPIKMAGDWLHTTSTAPIRILDSSAIIAFHAKASQFWLPCCDEKAALSYIEKKNVDFVVVRKSEFETQPAFMRGWADNGFPNLHAKLVYSVNIGTREKIMIYRIKR